MRVGTATISSTHGFDAYCRNAEDNTGAVERICVALDVGLEMHDAFDARSIDGPTRLDVVLPLLKAWIARKAELAPKTQWGLVVLRDADAELLLAPTERDIMLATLNSVAHPRPRPADGFEEEDDAAADAPFDFASLFRVLGEAFGGTRPDGSVNRCVVVFGRSRAVPVATGGFDLKSDVQFFLNAIYVHEKAAPPVRDVQAIYNALLKLVKHRGSYAMETTSSRQRLESHLLLLLAHPILRDSQDAALAKLDPEEAQRAATPPPVAPSLQRAVSPPPVAPPLSPPPPGA